MKVLHDRATFLRQYRRCSVTWLASGAALGVAIGFNANPIFEPELLGRIVGAIGFGLMLAGWPPTIIGERFHYLVIGKRTLAVYVPMFRRRFFVRREQCIGYRPNSKIIVAEGLKVRLAPAGVPWFANELDASTQVLKTWWPGLDSDTIQSEAKAYEAWTGTSVFLAVVGLSAVTFVAALLFLTGGFVVRVGVVIGLAVLATLVWIGEWHRRRCFEVTLPIEAGR